MKKQLIISICLIVIFGFAAIVYSVGMFEKQINIENVEKIEIVNPPIYTEQGEDFDLGASYTEAQDDIATSTTDVASLGGISVWDRIRYGDNPLSNQNSLTEKYLFKDCNNGLTTSTIFSIQNQEGQTIYIDRIGIELEGLSTSTMSLFVGTTSAGYITYDTDIVGVNDMSDSSLCSLMDDVVLTDGSVFDVTSTILWSSNATYAPCDRGYGTNMPQVPVKAGEYITGVASTTADGTVKQLGNYFECKVFIEYSIFE